MSMTVTVLPSQLQAIIEHGLQAMECDRDHLFAWQTRRILYRACHASFPNVSRQFLGWAAVAAAKHVLPIFTRSFPDDDLPPKLIRYAERILRHERRPRSPWVSRLLNDAYMGTGIDNLVWRTTIAYDAEYAGTAAHKALLEVSGCTDLLDSIEQGIERGWVTFFGRRGEPTPPISAGAITDRDLAHLAAHGDTAGAAAIAAACAPEQFHIDPEKLRSYWQWWGSIALPHAWQQALHEVSP
jgi:hypothetical protein